MWLADYLNIDYKLISLTKGYQAKTVYHLLTDDRSREAVVAAINFGRGLITREELITINTAASAAASAAYTAANTAYTAAHATNATYAAANAAYASANAAYSASNAIYNAANASANVAVSAAEATYAAADAAAKIKNQKKTADIARRYLTEAVYQKIHYLIFKNK
jgi:hypothetical protein